MGQLGWRASVRLGLTGALILGFATVLVSTPSAHAAQPSIPGATRAMPSTVPSAITPPIDNGQVVAIAQVGNTMIVGGTFTSVAGVSHSYVLAFDANTGAITSGFNPSLNGAVNAAIPGPTAGTVYLGGQFTQVNGAPAQFLTLLNVSTGQVVSSFQPPAFDYGYVNDLVLRGGRLYVAGVFTRANGAAHAGLVTVDPNTGRLDPFMNVQLTGHHNDSGSGAQGWVGATDIDVTPDASALVVVGNFKYADGQLRNQVALIDLRGSSAALAPWATSGYAPYCYNWAFDQYVRGVAFYPDGSYFVVSATGGGNPGTLCDSASRFDTNYTDTNAQPHWIDQTGGDTVWGVTITNTAVFVGGHNRWMNNPYGVDSPQPGAVPRAGLQALDPVSGRPLAWNPGRVPLGVSAFAFLATSQGLWMGSDTDYVGNYSYKRPKLAMFPWAGGTPVASTTTATLPGSVYLGNASGGANVLYRVDAGGGAIHSTDGGPDWADDSSDPSPYRNTGSNAANWGGTVPVTASVPASTPNAIFASERWSPSDNPPMDWSFPVATGTPVEVRLYFANRCSCTSQPGSRIFNVSLNGATVLQNYDIVSDVGDQVGTMKAFDLTVQGGAINIDFSHVRENPLINGIEIVRTDIPSQPAGSSALTKVAYDGTTASAAAADTQGIDFANWRGAFLLGSKVFYGYTDNFLYSRTFNGTTFGPAVKIDPYHDPAWANVNTGDGDTFNGNSPDFYAKISTLSGMVYSQGRVYFTLSGNPNLYSAWFSPDSGIIDETIATQTSSVDLSQADGLFISGGSLYYGSGDGNLRRVPFSGGNVSGTPTVVSGPNSDGVNWRSTAMFLGAANGVPNNPPMAAFTSSCQNLTCGFNGTSSTDTDGSIASYSWAFGDSTSGSGATPAHSYGAAGTYHVTLTVTDDGGATNSVTQDVTVTAAPTGVRFIGAGNAGGGSTNTRTVTIPASAAAGDTALLLLTAPTNAGWSAPGGVTGWSQVDAYTKGTLATTLWVKTLAAGDAGATVQLTNASYVHSALSLAVYRGVNPTTPIDAFAHQGDQNLAAHMTPTASAAAGDWAVSLWGDRSTATRTYTAPGNVTVRDVSNDSGGLTTQALIADSNGAVSAGNYGGLTATTDAATAWAAEWTVLLRPAGATPPPAQIAFKAAADAGGGSTNTRTVTVPSAAAAGDTALLFLTAPTGTSWSAPSGVTGWAQVDTVTVGSLITTLWVKTLAAGDPGGTVRLTNSTYTHTALSIAVYSGVSSTAPIETFARQGETNSANHVSPTATTALTGDWGVTIVGVRSGATRTFAPPATITVRDSSTDSGGLTTQTLIADSNGPLAPSTYGGVVTTTDAATSAAAEWTVLLRPAS